jgi:5-methylthioadenosine/S-adenosylhomocysteine deaminase
MKLENVIIKDQNGGYCKANIAIKEGLIEAIETADLSLEDLDSAEFYVTPGFVNCHLHPNQLLDRRLTDNLNISELLDFMHGDYKKTDKDRYNQALFVLMEAVKAGATSIYSVASNPYPVIDAYNMLGMKGAITCFYNDQWEGFGAPPALSLLKNIEDRFAEAVKHKNERFAIHVGSASVESASNELLLLIDELAEKFDSKVNIHVSEGMDSVQSCLQSRKLSPVRLLSHLEVLGPRWNLIHAVTLDLEEIDLIAECGPSIIHCPVSNAKTGVGVAPVIELMNKGVKIALGSDACSNNNTNNVLSEAYFAALIHSAQKKDARLLTTETLTHWLTSQGHEIIGTGQKGTISVGEPADLLLWSLQDSSFVPLAFGRFDAALIYNAPDIKPHSVLIEGRFAVKDYKFTLLPEKEIREGANRSGYNMQAYLTGAADGAKR